MAGGTEELAASEPLPAAATAPSAEKFPAAAGPADGPRKAPGVQGGGAPRDGVAAKIPRPLLPLERGEEVFFEFYQLFARLMWVDTEIDYEGMEGDWAHISAEERALLESALAFFAFGDDVVLANLGENVAGAAAEASRAAAYALQMQAAQEVVHAVTYNRLLAALVPDRARRDALAGAYADPAGHPAVAELAAWAARWAGEDVPLAERLVAFIAMEGGVFTPLFAFIRALGLRGLFAGLTHANELIARDEACHVRLGAALLRRLAGPRPGAGDRASEEREREILRGGARAGAALILDAYGVGAADVGAAATAAAGGDADHVSRALAEAAARARAGTLAGCAWRRAGALVVDAASLVAYQAHVADFLAVEVLGHAAPVFGGAALGVGGGAGAEPTPDPFPHTARLACNPLASDDFFVKGVSAYQTPTWTPLAPAALPAAPFGAAAAAAATAAPAAAAAPE